MHQLYRASFSLSLQLCCKGCIPAAALPAWAAALTDTPASVCAVTCLLLLQQCARLFAVCHVLVEAGCMCWLSARLQFL